MLPLLPLSTAWSMCQQPHALQATAPLSVLEEGSVLPPLNLGLSPFQADTRA